MVFGIICGLGAALLNSFGYLASARCVRKYNCPPFEMLVYAQVWMLLLALPIVLFLFPAEIFTTEKFCQYLRPLISWILVFSAGQGCFFAAQKYMEPSKIASLLGLKIIVLTLIVMLTETHFPNFLQWIAIFIAAAAGMLMNGNGRINFGGRGMLFVFLVLVCYSLSDINETAMVLFFVNSGIPTMKSALLATAAAYLSMGLVALPCLFFIKADRKKFVGTFGYSFPWLLSQIMLLACFARLLPVFANVLLSLRGVFSVVFGVLLSYFGCHEWDASLSRKQWCLRGTAAFFMILAVAIYSYAVM